MADPNLTAQLVDASITGGEASQATVAAPGQVLFTVALTKDLPGIFINQWYLNGQTYSVDPGTAAQLAEIQSRTNAQ